MQELIVTYKKHRMEPMVTNERERQLERFASRFNEALTRIGVPPKNHGRQTAVAKMFHVSQKGARKWLEGEAFPARWRFEKIASNLECSVEWLFMGYDDVQSRLAGEANTSFEPGPDMPQKFQAAPVVGTAQLGPGGYWTDFGYPVGEGEGVVDVPSRDPNAYALRVRGDSMAPAIRDSWVVVVEPNHSLIPGEYVLVCTKEGQCMVKELLFERDGDLHLMSIADGFGRIVITSDQIEKAHYVGGVLPPSKIRF